jgi:hypothetical protein
MFALSCCIIYNSTSAPVRFHVVFLDYKGTILLLVMDLAMLGLFRLLEMSVGPPNLTVDAQNNIVFLGY